MKSNASSSCGAGGAGWANAGAAASSVCASTMAPSAQATAALRQRGCRGLGRTGVTDGNCRARSRVVLQPLEDVGEHELRDEVGLRLCEEAPGAAIPGERRVAHGDVEGVAHVH